MTLKIKKREEVFKNLKITKNIVEILFFVVFFIILFKILFREGQRSSKSFTISEF